MIDTRPRFTCPVCEAVSYHPKDKEYGYCGACHDFTGLPGHLGEMIRQAVRDRQRGCTCRELPADPEFAHTHHPQCPLFQEHLA